MRARASFTPSPMKPTAPPHWRSRVVVRAFFCSGETWAKMVASRAMAANSLSDSRRPLRRGLLRKALLARNKTFSATLALSPPAIFTEMPSVASRSKDSFAFALGRSRKTKKPARTTFLSPAGVMLPGPLAGQLATATTTRDPGRIGSFRMAWTLGDVGAQRASTSSGAPW